MLLWAKYISRPYIACKAPGAAFVQSILGDMRPVPLEAFESMERNPSIAGADTEEITGFSAGKAVCFHDNGRRVF